jgi:predicted DNA-binding transcriptional regulator YafY
VGVRTDPGTADVLGYVFGTRMVERVSGIDDPVDDPVDGLVDLEIRGQSTEMMARQLAGFADAIEVLWPESVRVQLADIGRSLVAHHGTPRAAG